MRSLLFAIAAMATSPAVDGPAFECDLKNIETNERMPLTFVISRMPSKDADGVGTVVRKSGNAPLIVTRGTASLNFLEFTPAGNIMLLTVVLTSWDGTLPMSNVVNNPIELPAVYSRHTVTGPVIEGYDLGGIEPSQYRGMCKLKN